MKQEVEREEGKVPGGRRGTRRARQGTAYDRFVGVLRKSTAEDVD